MSLNYHIYKSSAENLHQNLVELTGQIPKDEVPVRLVFFSAIDDNATYLSQRTLLIEELSRIFKSTLPLVTFVAQAPLDCSLAMECQSLSFETSCHFKVLDLVHYAILNDGDDKILLTEGILPSSLDLPMKDQATEVFQKLSKILSCEHFPVVSINRQWNYIEDIVGEKHYGKQNYQELNDARSEFYRNSDWGGGYPAATGIGTYAGGIMVEVDAYQMQSMHSVAIDNEMQIAAHVYSSDVLKGGRVSKTTPKFERARAMVRDSGDVMVYVSGTAAIRGEASQFGVGIEKQTLTTLENIEFLISQSTLAKNNIFLDSELNLTNFRVYLKDKSFLEPARKVISERHPEVESLFLLSDVCRDELLIEIEAIAKNV